MCKITILVVSSRSKPAQVFCSWHHCLSTHGTLSVFIWLPLDHSCKPLYFYTGSSSAEHVPMPLTCAVLKSKTNKVRERWLSKRLHHGLIKKNRRDRIDYAPPLGTLVGMVWLLARAHMPMARRTQGTNKKECVFTAVQCSNTDYMFSGLRPQQNAN